METQVLWWVINTSKSWNNHCIIPTNKYRVYDPFEKNLANSLKYINWILLLSAFQSEAGTDSQSHQVLETHL